MANPNAPQYPTAPPAGVPVTSAAPKQSVYTAAVVQGQPMPPQQQQQVAAVPSYYAVQPTIQPYVMFGPHPQRHTCPYCGVTDNTRIDYEPGMATYLWSGGLCLFGCVLGCCLIPFCLPECQDVEHKCGYCGHTVGFYKRI